MEILLLGVIFGAVTSKIASSKGRDWFNWLFLGLLFGPIAMILVIVLPANQARLDRLAIKKGKAKKCPHCAEVIKAAANVCKHCGRDLPAE